MSTTRRGFLMASGAAAGLGLAGCSSNAPTGDSTGGDGQSLVEPSGEGFDELTPNPSEEDLVGGPNWTPPDLEGQEITMWGLNYAPHVDRYNILAAAFEEATGAKVKVEPQAEPGTTMLTAIAGGNVPDVICLINYGGEMYRAGAMLDLTDVVYSDLQIDMEKWWSPDAIEAFRIDGKHWGVPLEAAAVGYAVAGRLDLIDAAAPEMQDLWPGTVDESEWDGVHGVQLRSYDELFELGKALQTEKDGKVDIWGVNRQGWQMQSLTSIMWQLGVNFWDEESLTYDFDNDACVQGIDMMITKPYELGIESNLTGGNVANNYLAGQVALGIGSAGIAGQGVQMGFPGENVMAPSIVDGEEALVMSEGGWGFQVPAQGKKHEVAIEFARFMTTYEAQFIWSQIYGGSPPACLALENSEIFAGDDDLKRGMRRIVRSQRNFRYWGHKRDPQWGDIGGTVMDSVREGKLDARAAATELQEQLTALQQQFQ